MIDSVLKNKCYYWLSRKTLVTYWSLLCNMHKQNRLWKETWFYKWYWWWKCWPPDELLMTDSGLYVVKYALGTGLTLLALLKEWWVCIPMWGLEVPQIKPGWTCHSRQVSIFSKQWLGPQQVGFDAINHVANTANVERESLLPWEISIHIFKALLGRSTTVLTCRDLPTEQGTCIQRKSQDCFELSYLQ